MPRRLWASCGQDSDPACPRLAECYKLGSLRLFRKLLKRLAPEFHAELKGSLVFLMSK